MIIQNSTWAFGRKLGWLTPTAQHVKNCLAMKAAPSILAGVVAATSSNLYQFVVEVLNQLSLGSCTAQSAAQVIRMRLVADGHKDAPLMSRLLSYYLARVAAGDELRDVGSQICTVFEMIAMHGWVPEKHWPYDIGRFDQMPDTEAMFDAFDQRGKMGVNYYAIEATGNDRIDEVRKALTAGYAVTWGAPVDFDFCSKTPSGIIHTPNLSNIAGGHAQVLIGHEDKDECFYDLNSWGQWGEEGQPVGVCRVGYDYIKWDYTSDLIIVAKAPEGSVL